MISSSGRTIVIFTEINYNYIGETKNYSLGRNLKAKTFRILAEIWTLDPFMSKTNKPKMPISTDIPGFRWI